MNNKRMKTMIDVLMCVALLALMAFELIGRTAHEWIGLTMFVLFIVHHVLNRRWTRSIFNGRYTPYRIWQSICAVLVLVTMLGLMVSAVLISQRVFAFLPIHSGMALGRMLHMLCAYWGFLFMGLHVGAHWPALTAGMKRRGWLRVLAALAALYGAFAFFRRGFPEYMFLQSMFVFFDYEEPLLFFFLDYLAILAMMAWIGNMAARVTLKQTNR